jgi:hypothetical protein
MPPAPLTSGATTWTTRRCRPASLYRYGIGCTIRAIEVRFVAAFDKGLIVIEVFSTLDGNGTGIRNRLPFHRRLGLRPRSTRSRRFAAAVS